MKNETYVLELDDWERRLLVGCLNTARNTYLSQEKPVDDVCDLMEDVINAPKKRQRRRSDREAR